MFKKFPLSVVFSKISPSFWAVLLFELCFIFLFLFNYELGWLNPEKFQVEKWILANGSQWHKEDWMKFLNTDVIELSADRLSRPLSNFVEVIDTKWRAWMWNSVVPHPTLSLLWPLMLLLTPFLLYRALVNMGCYPFVAFSGICMYLTTLGFLSPMVMRFHPAKSLVNFFAALTLYLCSLCYKHFVQNMHMRGLGWVYTAIFISLFLGFMSDETAVFTYLIVLLLFVRVWAKLWRDKQYGALAGFAVLPLLYGACVKYVIPFGHRILRGIDTDFSKYCCYPSIKDLFLPNMHYFWKNMQYLFGEHPHWMTDYGTLLSHPVLLTLQVVYTVAGVFLFGIGIKCLFTKKAYHSPAQPFIQWFFLTLALMVAYCFFHTFQLSNSTKIWGIWWYGCLFSLLYVLAAVFLIQCICMNSVKITKWLALFIFIFVLHGLVFTTERIAVYKMQNYFREDYKFGDILEAKFDTYQFFSFPGSIERSSCIKYFTRQIWLSRFNKSEPVDPQRQEVCQDLLKKDLCLPGGGGICIPIRTLYLAGELP